MVHPVQQIVLQEYIDAANECTDRVQRITEQILALLPEWSRAPFVRAYQALRGVSSDRWDYGCSRNRRYEPV